MIHQHTLLLPFIPLPRYRSPKAAGKRWLTVRAYPLYCLVHQHLVQVIALLFLRTSTSKQPSNRKWGSQTVSNPHAPPTHQLLAAIAGYFDPGSNFPCVDNDRYLLKLLLLPSLMLLLTLRWKNALFTVNL